MPTYAANRTSFGAQYGDVARGGTGGASVRLVRGRNSLEVRGDRLSTIDDNPWDPFYVSGSSWVAGARRSIPTRDGWTALCVVAELGRHRQRFTSGAYSNEHHDRGETDVALGVGYAIPAPLSASRRLSVLYEFRVSRHWATDPLGYGSRDWWEREISVTTGLALPRDFTVTAGLAVAIFPKYLEGPAQWHTPRAVRLQLAMLYHFDRTP